MLRHHSQHPRSSFASQPPSAECPEPLFVDAHGTHLRPRGGSNRPSFFSVASPPLRYPVVSNPSFPSSTRAGGRVAPRLPYSRQMGNTPSSSSLRDNGAASSKVLRAPCSGKGGSRPTSLEAALAEIEEEELQKVRTDEQPSVLGFEPPSRAPRRTTLAGVETHSCERAGARVMRAVHTETAPLGGWKPVFHRV